MVAVAKLMHQLAPLLVQGQTPWPNQVCAHLQGVIVCVYARAACVCICMHRHSHVCIHVITKCACKCMYVSSNGVTVYNTHLALPGHAKWVR